MAHGPLYMLKPLLIYDLFRLLIRKVEKMFENFKKETSWCTHFRFQHNEECVDKRDGGERL